MKKFGIALAVAILGATGAASAQGSGTALAVSFDQPVVSCPAGDVTVDYTISTTAASAAAVTATLSGGPDGFTPVAQNYAILSGQGPGGWLGSGRTKTFDATFVTTGLQDGEYLLQVCATQAGSGGNPDKTVCRSQTVVVACGEVASNPCANTAPFGEVVHNDNISVNATAQINFKGDFGPTASVQISRDAYVLGPVAIKRNGDSCNYHANWKFNRENGGDFYGNNGPGTYTVNVTGTNGKTLEFSVVLSDTPNND